MPLHPSLAPLSPAPLNQARFSVLAFALFTLGLFGTSSMAQTTSADGAPTQLESIRVFSTQERADGPVTGYRATRSATATRTDTPIEDIPQTISVIPAQLIEDLDLTRIDRALDFAGGVIRGNNFGGVSMDAHTVRGFSASMAYNGFTSRTNSRAPEDNAAIERIEVLKGPSAGLFGQGDPGGLIHIVTKRPQADAFTQMRLSAGSWDRYRGTLDLNMPLAADGSVLSRVNLALEDNDSFRDHVKSERQFINPVLRWQLNRDTSLLIHTEFMRTKTVFDRGIIAINGDYSAMRRSTFLGEPADGSIRTDDQLVQVILEHALNPDWDLRLASQYRHGRMQGIASEPNPARNPNLGVDGMVPRRVRARDWDWDNSLTHAELMGRFELAGMRHQVLLGAEYEHNREYWDFSGSPILMSYAINAYNPVYGQPRPAVSLEGLTTRLKSYALNLQDQITFNERLGGQFGVRWDRYTQRGTTFGSPNVTHETHRAIVPRAGLMFKVTPDVGVFGNVSTSFAPNGISNSGETFKPEKGLGFETGVKLSGMDGRLGATLAAFHITKKNIRMPDPTDDTNTIAAGEAVSKGFEMQASGQVSRAVSLIAAYAYTHTEITKDSRPALHGGELANVPRHTASFMGVYEFQQGALQGTRLGAALTYVGQRRTSNNGNLWLPSYSVVDLFARWPMTKAASLNLNLNNIFDRKYLESALDTRGGVVGAPFNVKLSVTINL